MYEYVRRSRPSARCPCNKTCDQVPSGACVCVSASLWNTASRFLCHAMYPAHVSAFGAPGQVRAVLRDLGDRDISRSRSSTSPLHQWRQTVPTSWQLWISFIEAVVENPIGQKKKKSGGDRKHVFRTIVNEIFNFVSGLYTGEFLKQVCSKCCCEYFFLPRLKQLEPSRLRKKKRRLKAPRVFRVRCLFWQFRPEAKKCFFFSLFGVSSWIL